ncbi:MAG: IclR family transcriptional regulator [Rhodobacteraceae bacterium]|uniref:IclR family transcriptional regulator n=1 Tax=Salipiger sp. HF18 TaxID=2721557 RepID=UPI00142E4D32|nr:IclR family transcriptional regulator [Salipiger sp. HF18]NIY96156.1 IclR family transcriptional regulator [Salipiger sp. HF18]NVK61367.1 IclR family transcriptional regulator [Paracoccaceae bacterium]
MTTRNAPSQDELDTRLYMASVERTMRILAAFDNGLGSRTLADIAKQLDLGRSAVQRIVYTLEKLGYLEREADQRHYRLTLKILDLSSGLTSTGSLMRLIQPVLQDLADETGETSSWVKLDGDEIVIQQTVRSKHLGHVSFAPGQRFAALPSSSGQAILAKGDPKVAESLLAAAGPALRTRIAFADAAEMAARFAEIRAQGVATTAKEEDLFSVSISAPVLSSSGVVLGALNVSALESRVPHTRISEQLGAPIQAAAARVAKILEHQAAAGVNAL